MTEQETVLLASILDDVRASMEHYQRQNKYGRLYDENELPLDAWIHDVQHALKMLSVNL